ncbi:MAG: hypothetical protein K9N46_04530 [Candidatus Marinimicrobia bacterium]|nr:hypothetical protein [Candidatus Neomarinimicrobiota bacterium]MCF7829346.1 hypothetical protein [Candidatus Neomarinimicrobiota bacterium]MCF7879991.1 hypothetical protein [Candidatus Neomarinimicrobiota bacterium]
MLPTISINSKDIVASQQELKSKTLTGHTFTFSFQTVREESIEMGLNLDSFLISHIAYGISQKGYKSKFLIWYVPMQHMFSIYITSKGNRVDGMWLLNTPGRYEYGENYLHNNSKPYMYYDGKNIYRIYEKIGGQEFGLVDFGSLFGITHSAANKEQYEDIQQNEIDYWDYSVIPQVATQIIEWNGKKIVLNNAFYEFN